MSRNWPCVMKLQEEQILRKIYMIIYLLFSSSLVLVNTKIIGKRCFQPIFVNYRQYTNANYYQNSIVWNKWAICLLKRESQTKFARRTHSPYLSVLDFLKSLFHEIDFWTWFLNLIFTACAACKNPVWNRQKIKLKNQVCKLEISKINCRSAITWLQLLQNILGHRFLWRVLFA